MKLPRHIALIMDGNGRWAEKKGISKASGHQKGAQVMKKIVLHCFKKGIEVVSIFAFSTENWSRPKEEIDELLDITRRFLKNDAINIAHDHFLRLNFMGDLTKLPVDIQDYIDKIVKETASYKSRVFNIGINYGGRQELLNAASIAATSGIKNIDSAVFDRFLYTSGLPDPDMLIRTSGEKRLSNFMLYQLAYTELFFTDTLWPDLTTKEVDKLIEQYQARDRRFGTRKN